MKKTLLIIIILLQFANQLYAEKFNFKTLSHSEINITNFEGNFVFEEQEYKNKTVLLLFFGTKCPYCIKEIPEIIQYNHDIDNLKVIGIHAQHQITNKKLKKFIDENGIDFPVLKYNSGMKLVRYLKEKGMWLGGVPYHIAIDKHGNLEPIDFGEIAQKCY
jgi:thiol-disulfide isomerase/thioredoxin